MANLLPLSKFAGKLRNPVASEQPRGVMILLAASEFTGAYQVKFPDVFEA
jgi:hypothetical protein